MFSDNWFLSQNGAKREVYSDNAISHRVNYSGISNHQTAPKGKMETKLIFTILTWLGFGSYFGAIILNVGTWKADVLVVFGGAFLLLKFIRLTLKTWYECKRQEIEIKMLQKKANESEE
jgi:hypothetical protein